MVLRLGQRPPDFSIPDTEGKTQSLSEYAKKGAVLLAFFPFAFSGVCDKEMCTFRDGLSRFSTLGVQVVGVSVDSVFALKAFSQTYNLPFPLLSDFNKKVTRLYGVLQDPWVGFGYRGVAKRSVFALDSRMVLRYKWVTDNPGEEPPYEDVLKAVAKMGK